MVFISTPTCDTMRNAGMVTLLCCIYLVTSELNMNISYMLKNLCRQIVVSVRHFFTTMVNRLGLFLSGLVHHQSAFTRQVSSVCSNTQKGFIFSPPASSAALSALKVNLHFCLMNGSFEFQASFWDFDQFSVGAVAHHSLRLLNLEMIFYG